MKTTFILITTLIISSPAFAVVELSSFTAVAGDSRITLLWVTASEANNDHFEIIQDSQPIGTVSSLGNSSQPQNYSFVDLNVMNGITYSYTLRAVDSNGTPEVLGNVSATPQNPDATGEHLLIPNSFSLSAYPNPFNPSTTIAFTLNNSEKVNLAIFDIAGREVSILSSGLLSAGEHRFIFSGNDLPSGIYFARLQTPIHTQNQKLILLK